MRSPFVVALLVALLLTGCESVSDHLNARFDEIPPQSHEFAGAADSVYHAVQKAFRRLDFVLVRSSPARVEAASSIHTSKAFGDSRQLVALVRIRESEPGKCVVDLALTEDVSSPSVGGTHRTPLREHSFFDLYFATLQQVLSEQAAESPAAK